MSTVLFLVLWIEIIVHVCLCSFDIIIIIGTFLLLLPPTRRTRVDQSRRRRKERVSLPMLNYSWRHDSGSKTDTTFTPLLRETTHPFLSVSVSHFGAFLGGEIGGEKREREQWEDDRTELWYCRNLVKPVVDLVDREASKFQSQPEHQSLKYV